MAYQPKSYKKFVATAATATLVATAVAPTALAADFTDVSSNYKVAVDYLVDQGIAQGLTETTFGVTSPIKRGDAAVMIAKALGLDTVNAPDQGFTDLNDRVAGAVNAIVEAEIASGKTETTFAPDLYITRQEMAKVIANAYGLTGENTENTFSDVNDNWDEYVDALVEAGITKGYEDGTFGATDDVTRGQFALFIYRAEGQPLPVPAVSDLAFNEEGDQFTLTFAEGLPEGADLNFVLENYAITINGEPITEAQVEALALEVASVSDNRMVFNVSHTDLDELADALGGDEVTLSIGGKAATYTFEVEAPAPTVTSVTAMNSQGATISLDDVTTSGSLKINFSEAVDAETVNVNNVRIFEKDGNIPVAVTSNAFNVASNEMYATLDLSTVSGLDKNTEYYVSITNVKSEDGETLATKTVDFTTSTDAVVENIYFNGNSADNDNNANNVVDTITVQYDEALDSSTVTNSNVYLVDQANNSRVAATVSVVNGTNVVITPTVDLPRNKQYVLYVNNLKTLTGTDAEAYTKAFSVDAPTPLDGAETLRTLDGINPLTTNVWPKLTAGVHTDDNNKYYAGLQFNLTISEKLNPATVQENVQLVETETGTVVPTTVTYNSDANLITFVPQSDLKESTDYEIQFKGGLESDKGILLDPTAVNEVVDSESLGFTTLDITAPTVTTFTSKNGLTELDVDSVQEFRIEFSEAVSLSDVNAALVIAETSVNFTNGPLTGVLTKGTDYTVSPVLGSDTAFNVRVLADRFAENKAYQVSVIGKDLEGSALETTTGYDVLVDSSNNKLVRTSTLAFTTEGVDVTAPKATNVYKGTAVAPANLVTTATNVVTGDKFTFEFDEEINLVDGNKVVLQKRSGSSWTNEATLNAIETSVAGVVKAITTNAVTINDDATYRVVVQAGAVEDALGNLSTTSKVFEFIGSEGDDAAADVAVEFGTVTGTTFTSGNAVDGQIFVTFDEEEIFEVANSSVVVTDTDGNVIDGTLEEVTSTLTGTTDFPGTDKVYVFTPAEDLENSSVYTVTVKDVKDIAGNTIATKIVQFTTEAATVLVESVSVANGAQAVDRLETIVATLNQARALTVGTPGALTDGQISLTTAATPTVNVSGLEVSGSGATKSINFDELAANTSYVLTIDVEGETQVVNFTTGVVSTDDVEPVLEHVGTVSLAQNAGSSTYTVTNLSDNLVFDFNETINITNASVAVRNVTDDTNVAIISTTRGDGYTTGDATAATNDALEINPVLDLTAGKTYQVTISGVTDASGNAASTITVFFNAQ